MSRTKASPEAQILYYFKTAPLNEALLVFGLVKSEMKERGAITPKVRRKKTPDLVVSAPLEVRNGR